MDKLTFTLKQHTPLIHFQHDQAGATLRATEVKPKLDKFLKESLSHLDQALFDKFKNLIKGLPDPLKSVNTPSPYKMAIQTSFGATMEKFVIASFIPRQKIAEYENKGFTVLDNTTYFADNKPIKDGKEGKPGEAKLGLMIDEGHFLKLVFSYYDTQWEELLNKALPLFFASTNFGTRQSKGFGCFFISDKSIAQKEFENHLKKVFPIVFKTDQFEGIRQIFTEINRLYKILKSGDRNNDSELRKYFNDFRPVVEWEKPAIQEKIEGITGSTLKIKSKTNNRQFVRAVLGLAEIYEFPKQDGIKAQVKNELYARYGSPILFKVFGDDIYIVADQKEHSKEILNKTFNFEFNHRGRRYGEKLALDTPKEFDINDFLQKAMKMQNKWRKI